MFVMSLNRVYSLYNHEYEQDNEVCYYRKKVSLYSMKIFTAKK